MKSGHPMAKFVTKDGRRCVLRTLAPQDVDGLTRFANTIAREKLTNRDLGLVSFEKRVTREQERKWLGGVLKRGAERELVSVAALVDGRIVGHCDVHRRTRADDRHTGVFGIAILDGYRGVGIGERMMRAVIGQAQRIGIQVIELDVFSINTAAIHLYEKMGFKKAGTIPGKILRLGRYFDEDTMYLDLRKR